MTVKQMPTLPGKVEGIVGLNPLVLQCRDCGDTYTGKHPDRGGFDVILSGYHFHRCEGRAGRRRCPDCLAKTVAECPHDGCKR